MDLFLKFENEAQAIQALFTVSDAVTDEKGEVVRQTELHRKYKNVDTIGVIYKPTDEMEEVTSPGGEVRIVPKVAAIDGWHVNVRVDSDEDATPLLEFAVQPKQPMRVWA